MSRASAEQLLSDLGIESALDEVGRYVVRQRWSGAAGREVRSVDIEDAAQIADANPALLFCVVAVTWDDGGTSRYALPLGVRAPEDALAERSPEYMITRVGSGDDARLVYDALGDALYVQWCWRQIRDSGTTPAARGSLVSERAGDAQLPPEDEPGVRMLSVEQSNTSLVLDERYFFKHLRRIEDGPSQELEMATALRRAGFNSAVPVLGDMRYERDATDSPLVLLQPFMHNATEGWALALTSLRDLYADAEEQGQASMREVHLAVDDQGGAFIAESARLGSVTAGLHLTLAASALGAGFEPLPIDAATLDAWADSMTHDLDVLLDDESPQLDPLREARSSLVARFDAVRELPAEGLRIRVHGDLHLGQMLRVSAGWVILDFEGEPDRPPEERRQRSSPLRDVAGMLRSFDYAAAVALAERSRPGSAEWEQLVAYGDAWAAANRDSFWSAYLHSVGDSPLLPSPGATLVARRAFEVHKAVYETGYELGHRPSWASIPIRFLLRGVT
ncbi:MAG: hypothetical protein JOY68_01705 [Candidatus Dormibacteraeota bacterium]|nr:hypothetical protein [Candidatus Dormibacteraeota bacterium]MBV8445211.1 hypothetical protein [Candidatus Dormibacteraeota bacterium]